MDNRIDTTFADLRSRDRGRSAFIAYLCAGDPNLEATHDLVVAFDTLGVDIVELGIPFSDPLADGIVNQMAAQRALESGTTTRRVLELVRRIRKSSEIPLVLFTYLNPVYAYGFEAFHRDAADAGVDGMLTLDLPPDEEAANEELCRAHGLRHVRLIAPTTPEQRIDTIAAAGEGFIYYVSREGVTGEQQELADTLESQVQLIRRHTSIPVAVGFGISTPEQAATVAHVADGVVVGSAIVKRIAEHGADPDLVAKVSAFVRPMVEAVKSV